MSPRERLIKFFEYAFRYDDVVRDNSDKAVNNIMDMVDDKYGHLLGKDNE